MPSPLSPQVWQRKRWVPGLYDAEPILSVPWNGQLMLPSHPLA